MKKLSILLFSLTIMGFMASHPTECRADDIAHVGFGPSLDGTTNPKELALGYEKTWGEFGLLVHCGLLFESETNGYCAIVPGVHIETSSGIFVRAGVGPAYVMNTSARISGHWNANIDFMLGFYQGPAFFYFEGGHLSDAGATKPNLGDDHGLVGIGWRFGYTEKAPTS